MLRFSFIQSSMRLYTTKVVISVLFYLNSSIRLWALSGEVLLEMVGHTSIVYSVDAHASGLIVSGSEDRHAKIWKGVTSTAFHLCSIVFLGYLRYEMLKLRKYLSKSWLLELSLIT